MPYRPPAPGRRRVLIEMPATMLASLDAEAQRRCCSRADLMRLLVVEHLERQAAAKAA